jgi:hypothetical protein
MQLAQSTARPSRVTKGSRWARTIGSPSRRRPTFAIMALATSVLGGGPTYMICSAEHASLLSGMVPMYLLMSAFHLPPWLNLISNRSRRSQQSR